MSVSPSSSTRLTLLPTSYLAALPPDTEVTLDSLVEAQERLADEAKEVLPYAFDECSYDKGYLRQNVWSCVEHKLVELLTRRHFRCDCPTAGPSTQAQPYSHSRGDAPGPSRPRGKCTILKATHPGNDENRYGKNFSGAFCRCGRSYDPETETDGMLCCIACEDWLHETCLNLRKANALTRRASDEDGDEAEDEDEADVLIPSESYDGLICAECVRTAPLVERRAGTAGWMMVEPDGDGFKVVGRLKQEESVKKGDGAAARVVDPGDPAPSNPPVPENTSAASAGETSHPSPPTGVGAGKRALDDTADAQPDAKRIKAAWPWKGKGDVFLAHGVREALRAELPAAEQEQLPFPLKDEEVYEPRTDSTPEETLEEVTERVVGSMPRVQAIEALHGYQRLKDRLQSMLVAHSQAGRVVSKADIEEMFEGLRGSR